jgi:hypothetical protein
MVRNKPMRSITLGSWKMPKFHGYIVKKEYFAVDVDAEDKDQAKDLMWDAELVDEPVDTDWDIVDIEECQDA